MQKRALDKNTIALFADVQSHPPSSNLQIDLGAFALDVRKPLSLVINPTFSSVESASNQQPMHPQCFDW